MAYRLLEDNSNPEVESNLGYLGRSGARTLARGAESVLGLPGDIASAATGLANYGISKLT